MTAPKGRIRRSLAVVAGGAAIVAMLGGAAFAGSDNGSNKQIELTFDLSKCQEQAPNLYKCPAVDKPICTKDFQQPNVECIRIGKKGSVFVMMPGATVE
jgi:hypothetical protein